MDDFLSENTILSERLMLASEAADMGVWDWDIVSGEIIWDSRMYEIYGLEKNDDRSVSFERFYKLVHPDSLGHVEHHIEMMMKREKKGLNFSFKIFRGNDQDIRVIRSRGTAISDANGSIKRVIGVNVDITEIVDAERKRLDFEEKILQTQKLESLGVMAGGIAHDFNNMLAAIRSNIDLAILDTQSDHPTLEYLEEINNITQRASELCSQMTVYSGRQRIDRTPNSLQDIINDMKKLINISVQKNIKVRYELPEEPAIISCDVVQIRQLILNLVINASESIEQNRKGEITVKVTSCNGTGNVYDQSWITGNSNKKVVGAGLYCVTIKDNGTGMSEETIRQIFDPFFTTKITGRGLGLAAVLGILKSHKSAIKVTSEIEQGTTFTLFFPKSNRRMPAQVELPTYKEDWNAMGTVLLADDEDSVRRACEKIIKRHNLDVVSFDNGKSLLDAFKKNPSEFSLVILDLTMPEMTGDEVYYEIQKISPSTPVILMSGYHQKEISDKMRPGTVMEFVQKPFSIEEFSSAIRRSLEAADDLVD